MRKAHFLHHTLHPLIQVAQALANQLCGVTHRGNHGWQCCIVQAKRWTGNTDARDHLLICAENWISVFLSNGLNVDLSSIDVLYYRKNIMKALKNARGKDFFIS